jgi:hypothetical protein
VLAVRALHDAVAMALQATRPKAHDRDGGRQWLHDVKAVLRAIRGHHNNRGLDRLAIDFDAERFVALTGYTFDLARAWGTDLE